MTTVAFSQARTNSKGLHAHYNRWLVGGALTSLSYIPQVTKALPAGSTDDLSSKTLAVLATGLALWIGYGILKAIS